MGRVVILAWLLLAAAPIEQQLSEAAQHYAVGESALDDTEAQAAFNQALEAYHTLALECPSCALYANVAGCYYQLSEFAWAVLYYERAHALCPRDRRITERLAQSLKAAGIQSPSRPSPWLATALGAEWLSIKERVWLAILCGSAMALFGSLAIWSARRLFYRMALSLAITAAVMLGSVVALQVAVPTVGVLVQGAVLRCDAGEQYAPVTNEPLLAGTKVTVKASGDWTQIATTDGQRGYIPSQNLRLL